MSINQSINQYYCDNFHVQNLFPEYLHLVGEIFTSRSPSDPDVNSTLVHREGGTGEARVARASPSFRIY